MKETGQKVGCFAGSCSIIRQPWVHILGMKQYYNISIYCNIYYCNTIQYGLKEISIYCTLQYIVIYCIVCCLNVVNTQSLHHKNDRTFKNLDYTLQFLMLLYGHTGCIFFTLLSKPIFPYEMFFYQNLIKYCNKQYIAIHSNTIRNTVLTCIVSPLAHMHAHCHILFESGTKTGLRMLALCRKD